MKSTMFGLMLIAFMSVQAIAQTVKEWSQRAGIALNKGQYDEAITSFAKVIALDSTMRGWALYHTGIAYEMKEDLEAAARSFQEALDSKYSVPALTRRYSLVLHRLGRLDQAADMMKMRIAEAPEDVALALELVRVYLDGGKFSEARAELMSLLQKAPLHQEARITWFELDSLKLPEFNDRFESLLQSQLDYSTSVARLADMLVRNGMKAHAIRIWKNVLRTNPQLAQGYLRLISLYIDEGLVVEPKEVLPESITPTPEHLNACVSLAKSYAERGNPVAAEDLFNRILKADRRHPGAVSALLELYYQREAFDKAESLIRDYYYWQSGADWEMLAAKVFYRTRNTSYLTNYARRAISSYDKMSDSKDQEIYLKKTVCYLLLGDLASAEGEFQKYLSRGEKGGEVRALGLLQQLIDEKLAQVDASYLAKKYSYLLPSTEPAEKKSVDVSRDTLRPLIVLLSPRPERDTLIASDSYSLSISGIASDDQGISIVYIGPTAASLIPPSGDDLKLIQAKDIPVKFTGEALLKPGGNNIIVKAVDVAGNVTTTNILVRRSFSTQEVKKPKSTEPKAVLPKVWGVVIGISEYESKSLQLGFADRDAQLFYSFLVGPSGGAVSGDRLDLLTNRNATRAEIIRSINDKLRKAYEEDEVIIYIACHGVPDEVTNELYFLGYDSDLTNIAGTAISRIDLQKAISSARAKKVLLIADACHSGGVGLAANLARRSNDAMITNKLLKELSQAREGVAILTASSASEFSQEGQKWSGHGVFTYHLVNGVQGEGDLNGDGIVTIRELYEHVYREVADDTNGQQHPDLQGKFDNSLPVSVIK